MPKQSDPQDPEERQLPSEGLTGLAIRQRLNYKVSHKMLLCIIHSMAQHGTASDVSSRVM